MIVAYAVDVLWTLIAVIGVGVSSWALIDGYVDRRWRDQRGTNGVEKLVVTMNLRGAHSSLYLHTFFLTLGVFAFANPSPAEANPVYVLLVSGYIFVAATNVRAVGLNQIDRFRMRQGKLLA